ncbi:MAG: hypothetical protein IKW60_02315 [Clostridia bacterium]|nr:hypothetical protein [Clostridia bacterium]
MNQEFSFTDMEGTLHQVAFSLLHTEGEFRTYGIQATMYRDGQVEEHASVTERFITREEAEATVAMLCKYQVLPCTLKDIV